MANRWRAGGPKMDEGYGVVYSIFGWSVERGALPRPDAGIPCIKLIVIKIDVFI